MNDMEEKNMPMQDPVQDDPNETLDLQLAIEKLVDEEAAVLSHQEKLSGDVTGEQGGKEDEKEIEIEAEKEAENPQEELRQPGKKIHRKSPEAASAAKGQSKVSDWFFTFMCMNIPVIGWIYLMYLAFNRRHTDRRNFARAYLFYKLVFLTVALIIILILGAAALNLLDQLLAYMQML
jgi:hypothetical protein